MESIGLDMEDLFDIEAPADLGALQNDDHVERRGGGSGEEDDDDDGYAGNASEAEEAPGPDVLEKLKDLKGAARKRVMKPQPKLNEERLKTAKGLPLLPKIFEDVKFRGKGYEAKDLCMMMSKLEHWGHRLFPKMTFDEIIDRMEKLGAKREVQTCIKKIRLDMPMADEDFVDNGEDNEERHVDENVDPVDEIMAMEAELEYERLVEEEREAFNDDFNVSSQSQSYPKSTSSQPSSKVASSQDPAKGSHTNGDTSGSVVSSQSSQGPKTMTDEQKERMERNKRIALERKMARMGMSPSTPALKTSLSKPLAELSSNITPDNSHMHPSETPPDSNVLPQSQLSGSQASTGDDDELILSLDSSKNIDSVTHLHQPLSPSTLSDTNEGLESTKSLSARGECDADTLPVTETLSQSDSDGRDAATVPITESLNSEPDSSKRNANTVPINDSHEMNRSSDELNLHLSDSEEQSVKLQVSSLKLEMPVTEEDLSQDIANQGISDSNATSKNMSNTLKLQWTASDDEMESL